MRNDPPTSLNMRFGNKQTLASGMGFATPERSTRTINRDIKARQDTREAVRNLIEAKNDPEWIPLIEHRVRQGHSAIEIADELYWLKRYAWMKSKGVLAGVPPEVLAIFATIKLSHCRFVAFSHWNSWLSIFASPKRISTSCAGRQKTRRET